MTKKTFMRWKLKTLPTPTDITALIEKGVISKDEARDILFNSEEVGERSIDSLKQEIKFLRELVEKLANRSQITTTIKEVRVPYHNYTWYKPYHNWGDEDRDYCMNIDGTSTLTFSGITTF